MRDVIRTHACLGSKSELAASPAWAVFMGFEHERIHIETSSVLMRELPARCLAKPAQWPPYHPSALAWAHGTRRARYPL